MKGLLTTSACMLALLVSCAARPTLSGAADTDDSSSSGGSPPGGSTSSGGSSSGGSSGGSSSSGGTDADGTDTDGDDWTDTDGGVFIQVPEVEWGDPYCDPWAQDCPEGEKCMPWANDGGSSWNATKCSPIDPNPKEVGEPCTVEGNGVSGVDDCVLGAMCWDVDPTTNEGYCVAFCQGTPDAPFCENPYEECRIHNDGVLILCLSDCDPLLQNCSTEHLCVPMPPSGDDFGCVPDASGDEGQYGDPCDQIDMCDPGLFCASASSVPNCDGSPGCCTEFCDLTAFDPDQLCSGAAQGTECLPYFEEGTAPPGLEHVGMCVIPP